jgi:hypothetical protein
MKLAAADGEILWAVHDEFSLLDDRGWAIVVGPDDHPVVTGVHSTPTDPARYRTFKLDTADGSEIWAQTFPGAVNHLDREAGWLAVCDNGDIVMVNRTWESGTGYDVVLHRYAAADGDTVWTARYDSSGGSDDPTHMIRDSVGDLLVTGARSGDYMVLKFDGADGGLLWSEDYDGPAAGYDAAAAVAEGPGGEVVVTGFSTGSATNWDVSTVAFDPTDGAWLWEAHFDPGDGRYDEGRALAVGPEGGLYVTGYCESLTSGTDLVALRYVPDDPTDVDPGPPAAATASSRLRITAHPNPFVHRLSLVVDVEQGAPARLAVYDVAGRRAALLHQGALSPGTHRIEWDGRGDSGGILGAGVYLVRLESAGATAVRKIVWRP